MVVAGVRVEDLEVDEVGVDPGDVPQLPFGGVVEEAVVKIDDPRLQRFGEEADPLAVEVGEVFAMGGAEVAVGPVDPAEGRRVVGIPAPLGL